MTRAQGQQPGITWAGSDQKNLPALFCRTLSERRCRCGFANPFNRSLNHQRVRGQRLTYAIADALMMRGDLTHLPRQVSSRVSSGRKKIRMNDDLARAARHQPRKTFSHVRMFYFQKGGFNQGEATALANQTRGRAHIFIGLSSTAAMADN